MTSATRGYRESTSSENMENLIRSDFWILPWLNLNFRFLRFCTLQYMIILFMLFLIQFSIASSCLAVNSEQQQQFAEQGWMTVPTELRQQVQDSMLCCGFNATGPSPKSPLTPADEPTCDIIQRKCCSSNSDPDCHCPPCGPLLQDKIDYAFKLCGGLGIFFSFTEVGLSWIYTYTHSFNPLSN